MPIPNADVATTTSTRGGHEVVLRLLADLLGQARVVAVVVRPALGEQRRRSARRPCGSRRRRSRCPSACAAAADDLLLLVALVQAALAPTGRCCPGRAPPTTTAGSCRCSRSTMSVADRRRRRRGHGDDPGVQAGQQLAQPEVVGPEVVAPRRHAVRLVDGDQARPQSRDRGVHGVVGQLLGGEEQELDLPGRAASSASSRCFGRLRRRHPPGPGAAAVRGEVLGLVLLQGEQRRHDERRPVDEHGRQLVGQRLPGPGRLHEQHVVPVQQRLHRLAAARPAAGRGRTPRSPPRRSCPTPTSFSSTPSSLTPRGARPCPPGSHGACHGPPVASEP